MNKLHGMSLLTTTITLGFMSCMLFLSLAAWNFSIKQRLATEQTQISQEVTFLMKKQGNKLKLTQHQANSWLIARCRPLDDYDNNEAQNNDNEKYYF